MFRNTFHQNGLLSILYSIGSKPLQLWQSQVEDGQVQRITDPDIASSAIEITGQNISTSYITCPSIPDQTLAVNLPVIVFLVKNLNSDASTTTTATTSSSSSSSSSDHKDSPENHHHHHHNTEQTSYNNYHHYNHFSFEIEILDSKGYQRKLRFSTFHNNNNNTKNKVSPTTCSMPLQLDPGWNSLAINLDEFVSKAYNTKYVETVRVTIHANCRLRRVYFADKVRSEDELPVEYQCRSKRSCNGTGNVV